MGSQTTISQEVGNNSSIRNCFRAITDSVEDLEATLQVIVNVQDRSNITASVAVVRCRPDGHQIAILEPVLESIHDKLVSTSHQIDVINVVKLAGHLGSEQPTGTTRRQSPGFDVLGIRPHQVAEGTLVRNLHSSFNQADLIKRLDIGRETTVDTEDFTFDNGTNTEVVENFGAVFPWVRVTILSDSLIIETVNGSDLSGLVVTSEQGDGAGVLQLEAHEKLESFNGVVASINEVTHENVLGSRDLTTFLEKFQKIMELTVDITAYSYWSTDWLHI